jgi:hypothetical protein
MAKEYITEQWANIETLKKGEFFKRKPEQSKVYTREDYCRYTKKYEGQDWDNISRYCYFKKGTKVWVGFTF